MRLPAVFLGVPIDDVTMVECIDRIGDFILDGRLTGRTHQVATANVDFLVNANPDTHLTRILQDNAMNLADGMPIVWASRRVGSPLVGGRVAGSDLVPLLISESAKRGWHVHFFGGADGVAERARLMALDREPAARVTADAGPVITDPAQVDSAVIDRIRDLDPDILCVALGNPKQERFIAAQAGRLGCPVMIGIGGSLDMMIGERRRSPAWMQRIGAEWVFRAAEEPGRLGPRYLRDIRVFGPAALRYVNRTRRHRSGSNLDVSRDGALLKVAPTANGFRADDWESVLNEIETVQTLHLVTGANGSITPASHAALVGLVRAGRHNGVRLSTTTWSPAFVKCLADYQTLSWMRDSFGFAADSGPGERPRHEDAVAQRTVR